MIKMPQLVLDWIRPHDFMLLLKSLKSNLKFRSLACYSSVDVSS